MPGARYKLRNQTGKTKENQDIESYYKDLLKTCSNIRSK